MTTISLRIDDDDKKLIDEYVKLNHLNLSEFIRNTILEKIEDEMQMSEQFVKELVKAKENAKNERLFTLEDPRLHGKALTGNLKGFWQFRVGDFRLFSRNSR